MTDPFCDPKELAKTSFYRGRHFMVLYNIRPVLPGHSLFVPKRHVTRITELTEDEAEDLHKAMKEVIPVLTKLYGAGDDSYNIAVQAGPSSERTIEHFHMHIIPRRPDDRYRNKGGFKVDISQNLEDLGPEHVKREVERLRRHFNYAAQ